MSFDREKANQEREKFQDEVELLGTKKDFVLVEAATGTGKGKACLRIIDRDESGEKWLVVVPELLQIENLRQDIEKHGMQHLYDTKIEAIICYASFVHYKGWKGCIWFNEVHKLSKLRADISSTITYKKILADSATVPSSVKTRLNSLGRFAEYNLPLQQAINRGILPEPSVHIIYTHLDDQDRRNPVKRGTATMQLTDKAFLEDLENRLDYWKKKSEEAFFEGKDTFWPSLKMNQLGGMRKKFLAQTKTPDLKKLLQCLGTKRTICFTGSLDQCNEVGEKAAIHSKKSKKHNLSTLQAFNDGELEKIYVLKMGREGLNLSGIECVIIVQLGSGNDNGLEFIQISGRGLRGDAPEIYILVAQDTADERSLSKSLSHLDKKYIHYEQEKQVSKKSQRPKGIQGKKRG
jgi:superfamily II DNA or RNA helicase